MRSRLSHILASIRFGLWKARTYHAQRYVSIITLIIVLGGLAFFSYHDAGFLVKKARAYASLNWDGTNLTIAGSDSHYLLQKDTTSPNNSCIYPLNPTSVGGITNNAETPAIASYKGRICFNTADTTAINLTVDDNARLVIAGSADTQFQIVTVLNGGTITTAEADAKAKASPYTSRPDYWAARWTGFVRIAAGARYEIWAGNDADDSLYVEVGQPAAATVSVDEAGANFGSGQRYSLHRNGDCKLNPSFYATSQSCSGVSGTIPSAAIDRRMVIDNTGGPTVYLPIRISGWEVTGNAVFRVGWKVNSGSDTTISTDALYAPIISGPDAGKVDTSAQHQMRFEYGTGWYGIDPESGGDGWTARDFSNAKEYGFFPRVNVSQTGTFSGGFGKRANTNFDFEWTDSTTTAAGSPLSNSQSRLSFGSRIGARPPAGLEENMYLMNNYKLQTHDNGNTTGIDAGLRMRARGDMVMTGFGKIDVTKKGLPGGYAAADRGAGGVGGRGRTNTVSWWNGQIEGSQVPSSRGSIWNQHGGGGGGGGKALDPIGIGGGGGGIGYGSAGMIVDASGLLVHTSDRFLPAHGGGGFKGLGGGLTGTWPTPAQNWQDTVTEVELSKDDGKRRVRYNGTSQRGQYLTSDVTGMGGGGGQGGCGNPQYCLYEGGSGGSFVRLTVGRSLTMTNATIEAQGEATGGPRYGSGAGGAGTIDINVTNTFTFDENSFLIARGGNTLQDPTAYDGVHAKAGEGGGGLLKVRAATYEGKGWPTEATMCGTPTAPVSGELKGQTGLSNLMFNKGGNQAEDGIADLRFISPDKPFCGTNLLGAAANVQVSKQIQSYIGTSGFVAADLKDDSKWSNVATVVPGKYIRVVITIHNPSSSEDKTITVDDTLPISDMRFNPTTACVQTLIALGSCVTEPSIGTGPSMSLSNVTVPAGESRRVMYSSAVTNPF